jgi:hypothetical protein
MRVPLTIAGVRAWRPAPAIARSCGTATSDRVPSAALTGHETPCAESGIQLGG